MFACGGHNRTQTIFSIGGTPEHAARAALQLADYGYVLETGEIVLEGAVAELAKNPRVMETYLGLAREED